jgi:hypothetical protein
MLAPTLRPNLPSGACNEAHERTWGRLVFRFSRQLELHICQFFWGVSVAYRHAALLWDDKRELRWSAGFRCSLLCNIAVLPNMILLPCVHSSRRQFDRTLPSVSPTHT